jgi:hypothetical protein
MARWRYIVIVVAADARRDGGVAVGPGWESPWAFRSQSRWRSA